MRLNNSLCLSGIGIIVISQLALAQPLGQIVGKVVDAQCGEPLENAFVVIISTTLIGQTDEKGTYLISRIPPGVYDIRAVNAPYDIDTVYSFRVLPNARDTLNFNLYAWGSKKACEDIAQGIVQVGVNRFTNLVLPENIENQLAQKYGFKYNYNPPRIVFDCGYIGTVNQYLENLNGEDWHAKYQNEQDSLIQRYSHSPEKH